MRPSRCHNLSAPSITESSRYHTESSNFKAQATHEYNSQRGLIS